MMKARELRIGNYIRYRDEKECVVSCLGHKFETENTYNGLACGSCDIEEYNPIPLTEEWLLKFGFENWGLGTQWCNEYESYIRYVLHNVLDGTSNFELHYVNSTYGGSNHYQYIISCDEDDRLNWGEEIKHVHQLQNLYYALTGEELIILN